MVYDSLLLGIYICQWNDMVHFKDQQYAYFTVSSKLREE